MRTLTVVEITVCAAGLAAAMPLRSAAQTPDPGHAAWAEPCQEVAGAIDARASRLGLDLRGFKVSGPGSISGGLVGPLRVEVRRVRRRGAVTELLVAVTASTNAGPIELAGEAFAERMRPEDPFHRVHGSLSAVSEGRAAGPTGRLSVMGTVDTDDRLIAIHYEGVLCGANLIRATVAEAA